MNNGIKMTMRQHGYTLIELMIAMLLGAFLIGGGLQLFLGTKQSNRMQENLSRLQESGRFAMDFLEQDLRMTGYWGCMIPSAPDNDVSGTEGAAGVADSITLRGGFVRTPSGAVCGTAMVVAATVCTTPPSTPANVYADPNSIITYSVVNGALRRATNCTNTTDMDLIDGVDNMQAYYGEDTDADGVANYYVPANNVVNMANVISIRVTLLLSTLDDNLLPQVTPYTYNGITTNDRKIRRLFTSTIAIRNRQ